MAEPTEPKLTKRQRGLQESEEARARAQQAPPPPRILIPRRGFLIGTGAGLIALGVAAAGYNKFSESGETDFAKFLNDLNYRVHTQRTKNSQLLLDNAAEITERAFDQVGKYLGSQPTTVKGNVQFYPTYEQFTHDINQMAGCDYPIPKGVSGVSFYQDDRPSQIGLLISPDMNPKHPATDLADAAIHEDLHFRTQTRDFKRPQDLTDLLDPTLPYHLVDGLRLLYYLPEDALKNTCTIMVSRRALLEANYQYSTLQILSFSGIKLGPNSYTSRGYPELTKAFAARIGHLFLTDSRDHLLVPSLQSDPKRYYRNIGLRINPTHNNPQFLGEERAVQTFKGL